VGGKKARKGTQPKTNTPDRKREIIYLRGGTTVEEVVSRGRPSGGRTAERRLDQGIPPREGNIKQSPNAGEGAGQMGLNLCVKKTDGRKWGRRPGKGKTKIGGKPATGKWTTKRGVGKLDGRRGRIPPNV